MADPQITYPSNNATGVSTTPTISWSAVTGATKYKLQVDTANTFDSGGGSGLLVLDSHSAISKATQKPKQWGTLSAVQSAIRHNCEEWLGVPYEALKLCLPFWEGAGGVAHDIANANDAVISDAVFTNNGLTFNRGNNYAQVNRCSDVEPSTEFTLQISGVFNDPGSLQYNQFFAKDKNTWNEPYYSYTARYYKSTGKYDFHININGTWHEVASEIYSDLGEFVTLCFVYDKYGYMRIYRNGVEIVSEYKAVGSVTYYDTPLYIGYSPNYSTGRLSGCIDLTKIYNAALSPTQISAIHEQPYRLLQPTNNKVISIPTKAPLIEEEIVGGAGLLILDSHSATYKATQKPKQWGPLSAVQNAVRHNCEKWLGVDSEKISAIPLFENAGLKIRDHTGLNLIYSNQFSQCWSNTGLTFNGVDDKASLINYFDNTSIGSIAATIKIYSASSSGHIYTGGDYHNRLYFFISNGKLGGRLGGDSEFLSADILPLNEFVNVMLSWGDKNARLYINGAEVSSKVVDVACGNDNAEAIGCYEQKATSAYNSFLNCDINFIVRSKLIIPSLFLEQPYRLLQPTANKIISIGSSTPATSKQVTLAAGTTHYARVAADTP